MSKEINYNQDARTKLKSGVDQLAKAVVVTLGPKGRNVIIDKQFGNPIITKDGVTVAKEVDLKDPIENLGVKILKEASIKTADIAGDGTTTSIVLAQEIVNEGFKNIAAGANPMDLKRGIDIATKEVIKLLKEMSKPIQSKEEIAQVGAISANNDKEIGDLIADAMEKIGKDGVITVEESKSIDTYVETTEGLKIDKGYISHHFINNPDKGNVVLENVHFLLYDKKISSMKDILKVLELMAQQKKSIILIADDFDGDVIPGLVINKLRGAIQSVAVKAPGLGDRKKEILEDIAILTGGVVISEEKGYKLDSIKLEYLGVAEKVIVTNDSTTIVNGKGSIENIKKRVAELRVQIDNSKNDFDKEKLQERLAKLSSGVAILKIGAVSEIELKEKKARVEDALHATKAAVEEGIVPGGGIALVRISQTMKNITHIFENSDQSTGWNIIAKSILKPLLSISSNAGVNGEVVLNNVLLKTDVDYGYNAQTDKYGNLYEMGVVDPTKVTRVALEHASSVASILLTTEASIVEIKEENNQPQMPDMSQMY
jgi:chaperonin GroEL